MNEEMEIIDQHVCTLYWTVTSLQVGTVAKDVGSCLDHLASNSSHLSYQLWDIISLKLSVFSGKMVLIVETTHRVTERIKCSNEMKVINSISSTEHTLSRH